MPLKYESPEFSEELRKRINSNNQYREKAKGVNWKTLFIVSDLPFATFSSYSNGELVERRHVPPNDVEKLSMEVDFVVQIPTYKLSVDIAAGNKSLESLFMSGKLKLEGSIFKALQFRDALETAAKITTELVNESVIPEKSEFSAMLREQGLL